MNRDALRQALKAEEAWVRRDMRTRRRGLWIGGIVGTGMAVWAGFWIAITITNGWPAISAIASIVSLGMFALAAGALWVSRGREPERNFGNTLQDELRRGLALVDYQLSLTRHWSLCMLGAASIVVGSLLFSWTVTRSQDISDSSGGGWWTILLLVFFVWAFYQGRDERRKARAKLKLRQQRLRELLAALDGRE